MSGPGLLRSRYLFECCLLVLVVVAGYYYHVEDLQLALAAAEAKEVDLKKDFETKAFQAANLNAYRQQMVEMEESFGATGKPAAKRH